MMSERNDPTLPLIAQGERVNLRRWVSADIDPYLRWMTQGEWLLFDAPWEENVVDEERYRKWFLEQLDSGDKSRLNNRAVITTLDNFPLGWVNRYREKNNPNALFVGIDICEDKYLDRGLGTEALLLWVDHLFTVSKIHRLGLDTWSFNHRMIRVAEKVGFVYEGCQREIRRWQGEWLGAVHFGLLREEWQRNVSAAGG